MSWSNSRKSLAEKQLDAVTIKLPEEFTTQCVKKTEMVEDMKALLESTDEGNVNRKVHEPEAQLVFTNTQQMLNDMKELAEVNTAFNNKYGDKIGKIENTLQQILDQSKNDTASK